MKTRPRAELATLWSFDAIDIGSVHGFANRRLKILGGQGLDGGLRIEVVRVHLAMSNLVWKVNIHFSYTRQLREGILNPLRSREASVHPGYVERNKPLICGQIGGCLIVLGGRVRDGDLHTSRIATDRCRSGWGRFRTPNRQHHR